MARSEAKKRAGRVSTFILLFILLAGLALLLYPTVSDCWNRYQQTKAVEDYAEQTESMSAEEAAAMIAAAEDFNRRLAEAGSHFPLNQEEKAAYLELLNVTPSGMMGYVEIPSIKVYLPIYHGTEESILQMATGHMEGTSLPVGGESTHCAITGHRGLPSARLFTDLDQLQAGDIFKVTVLDRTVTYVVDQIRVVLPDDMTELEVQEGKDLCTLVTCTPYGVNSHRMLVRGTRIEDIKGAPALRSEASRVSTYVVVPALAVPLVLALLAVMLVFNSFRRPRKDKKELLSEYRDLRGKILS